MTSSPGITPLKCAVKFTPPTLVLFYRELAAGKTRRRSMPLRGFKSDTDVRGYVDALMNSRTHSQFIRAIPRSQVERLLQRVKDSQLRTSKEQATPPKPQPPVHRLPPLNNSKLITGASPNDDIGNPSGLPSNEEPVPSGFHSNVPNVPSNSDQFDYSDDFNSEAELVEKSLSLAVEELCKYSSSGSHGSGSLQDGDFAASFSDPLTVSLTQDKLNAPVGSAGGSAEGEDLNKASDERLTQAKAEMEVLFEANRLKPGDPGYVYDKEVRFEQHPQGEGGDLWDSDEDSWMEERLETGFDFASDDESQQEF